MTETLELFEDQQYLERMRSARKGPAVLKTRLAALRSALPDLPILAFEGDDDKIVYFHWICKLRPDLNYEPFPCDGKTPVLQFREMIRRDLNDIGRGIYYFVDRDFDDLQGFDSSDELFMTDCYSVENYLVSSTVLEQLLKNEFHCHAEPACRADVINIFESSLDQFLTATTAINRRLFFARQLRIKLNKPLPDKVGKLADVELERVTSSNLAIEEVICMSREPSEEEVSALSGQFDSLEPSARFRGKFLYLFFLKWLEHLALDRNAKAPLYFPPILNGSKVKHHQLTLDSLASKSLMPVGLGEFIGGIKPVAQV